MDIRYTDRWDTPITKEQSKYMEAYNVHYYENGEIRMIKEYNYLFKHSLQGGKYFMLPNENLQNLVQELVIDNLHFKQTWEFFSNKQVVGNYTLWDVVKYHYSNNGQPSTSRTKRLLNSLQWLVGVWYYENHDYTTFIKCTKNFYSGQQQNNVNDNLFIFEYNENGDLYRVYDFQNSMNLLGKHVDRERFIRNINSWAGEPHLFGFNWQEKTWYHNAFPIIPEPGTI